MEPPRESKPGPGIAPGVFLFYMLLAAVEWRAMPAVRANLIEEDGAYWASLAGALARGDWAHGLSTAWPPGYPALIAVLAWIARGASHPAMLEGCARFVSVIAGTLVLIPLFGLPYALFVPGRLGTWSLGEKGAYNFWRAYRTEYARVYPPPTSLAHRVNESPEIAGDSPRSRARGLPAPGQVGGPSVGGLPDPDQVGGPRAGAGSDAERVHLLGFMLARPGAVLGSSLRRLARIVFDTLPTTLYWPIVLLVLFGFAGVCTGPWWIVVTPLALSPLLYAPFSTDRRVFLPLVPPLPVWGGPGVRWVDHRATSASGA